MKDERGLYYYPNPGKTSVRVYVRRAANGDVEFRLWESEHPVVWEKHGWIPTQVIERAARMYKGMGRESDPLLLYDAHVARALLTEEGQ